MELFEYIFIKDFWNLCVILILLTFVYCVLTHNLNYWSSRGVPGPKPFPGLGNFLELFYYPQPGTELRWFKKFGKVYGTFFGSMPVLTVGDPELLKIILVRDFHLFTDRRDYSQFPGHPITKETITLTSGDVWRRIRSITTPAFTTRKLRGMYPMISECVDDFAKRLEFYAKEKQNIDCKDIFSNLSLDVMSSCAFATKIISHKDTDNILLAHAKRVAIDNFALSTIIPLAVFPKFLINFFCFKKMFSGKSTDFLLDYLADIIDKRKKSNTTHADFVQLLMNAEMVDDQLNNNLDVTPQATNKNLSDKQLTDVEILAQSIIFFLAGYETTATTLAFAAYELALNPEVQERLFNECDEDYTCDEIVKLPYLDAVISETLRLHAPILRVPRTVSTDYELGDTGIKLFKGQMVEIPIYAIHYSEEFYPDPFKFNPDRFMPENRHLIKPYTYLPFTAGPRNCIGVKFALMEIKICLAKVMRKYRFFPTSQTEVPPNYLRSWFLNIPKKIVVGVEMRS